MILSSTVAAVVLSVKGMLKLFLSNERKRERNAKKRLKEYLRRNNARFTVDGGYTIHVED